MTHSLHELSRSAEELHTLFDAKRGNRVMLTSSNVADIADRLCLMAQLARVMEQELAAHRIGEANRAGRAMVEELSTEAMRGAVSDAGQNVIRLNVNRSNSRRKS